MGLKQKIAVGLLMLFGVVNVSSARVGIATGREGGTYYRFGEDIAQVGALGKSDVFVYQSKGAIQNLLAMYDVPQIQAAITQLDVVYFMNEFGNELEKEVIGKIRVLLPLYDEEIHVVARNDIKSFFDLHGRRVALGEEGSGTALTAQVLLSLSGVEPAERIWAEGSEAVARLLDGSVDALIQVAGSPFQRFQEEIPADADVHLLPMTDAAFGSVYDENAEIPGNTYAWEAETVRTVAIRSLLVTMDYPEESSQCQELLRLSDLIVTNMDWLISKGHEKWAEVDLHFPVGEQIRSPCSALYAR